MKMLIPLLAAGLALGAASASPAGAAGQNEPGESAIADIVDQVRAQRYPEALAEIERLLGRRQPAETVRELETLRGSVLMITGRGEEARAAFARAEATDPGNPATALYQLGLAFDLRTVELILPALDHLIDRYPSAAGTVDPLRVTPLIGWLRRNERESEADDLLIRLAGVGFGGDDLATRDNYAIEGARAALEAGRVDQARAIAARVNSRRELIIMLTERRFSPLWPELEARVGPHMATAETAFVREAEALFAADPADPAARRSAMEAYRMAGRLADAERIGAAFAATEAQVRRLDEMGGWVVNDHAMILHAMGRTADAAARLAQLRVLNIESARWLISMVINRLVLLAREGFWDRALALQGEAASLAERHGSPYARQLVRRLQVCAFDAVGRERERDAVLAELVAHEQDSAPATIEGLICVGRMDEAEAVLLRWFAQPGEESGPVDALQPSAVLRNPVSAVDRGWQELAERPAVRAALERVGRVLPEAFWPAPASGT